MHGKTVSCVLFGAAICIALFPIGARPDGNATLGRVPANIEPLRSSDAPVPQGAILRLGTLRLRVGALVTSLAFSAKEPLVASGTQDGGIFVWDYKRLELSTAIQSHKTPVYSVAFSPLGSHLAAGGGDGVIRIFDTNSGKVIRSLLGHKKRVASVAFSPDGSTIVSGSWDKTIRLWDTQSGRQLFVVNGHTAEVSSACFAEGGKSVISASFDQTVRLWRIDNGREKMIRRGVGLIYGLAASPDGKTVFISSADPQSSFPAKRSLIRKIDIQTGEEKVMGPVAFVTSVTLSQDGALLASAGIEGIVRLWDTARGVQISEFAGHNGAIVAVAISPDKKVVACAGEDRVVRVWETASGKEMTKALRGHGGKVNSVAFSPDGRTIASGGADRRVLLWRPPLENGPDELISKSEVDRLEVTQVGFAPDGTTLVCAPHGFQWNLVNNREFGTVVSFWPCSISFSFSPDGTLVAMEEDNGVLGLWRTKPNPRSLRAKGLDTELKFKLKGYKGTIYSSAFSHHGLYLALGTGPLWGDSRRSAFGDVLVVNTSNSVKRRLKPSHSDTVTGLHFSLDERKLVSVSLDKTLRVWDTRAWRILLQRDFESGILCSSISPDGRVLALGMDDGSVRLLETLTFKESQRFQGHRGPVTSVSFAPFGEVLASGSEDTTILLWDLTGLLTVEGTRIPMAPGIERWIVESGLVGQNRGRGHHTDRLDEPGLERLWGQLAGEDAAAAGQAIWSLASCPDQSVPFLGKRLHPVPRVEAAEVKTLILELDNEKYEIHKRSFAALMKI